MGTYVRQNGGQPGPLDAANREGVERELALDASRRHVDDLHVAARRPDGADRNVLVPVLQGERGTHSEDEGGQSEAGQNPGS